jgi:hypothetical protein
MILEWLDVSENLKELESLEASIDPTVIKADIPKYINRLHSLSSQVFHEFCRFFRKHN